METIDEENTKDQETDVKKRPVDIWWILIFVVILIVTIVTQRRKKFVKMVTKKHFFIGIVIVTGYIIAMFFVKDPLYNKAIYAATVALIIAIFAHLELMWSPFFLVVALTMSFPSLQD